jgi:hypothetical protein
MNPLDNLSHLLAYETSTTNTDSSDSLLDSEL